MPKPILNTVSALDLAGRDRPLGPLARIDLGIVGVVQVHAGDVKQRQGHQERRGPDIGDAAAGQHDAGERVGPHGRQVGHPAEPQRDAPVHALELLDHPGELARDRARHVDLAIVRRQDVPGVGLDLEMAGDRLPVPRQDLAQERLRGGEVPELGQEDRHVEMHATRRRRCPRSRPARRAGRGGG